MQSRISQTLSDSVANGHLSLVGSAVFPSTQDQAFPPTQDQAFPPTLVFPPWQDQASTPMQNACYQEPCDDLTQISAMLNKRSSFAPDVLQSPADHPVIMRTPSAVDKKKRTTHTDESRSDSLNTFASIYRTQHSCDPDKAMLFANKLHNKSMMLSMTPTRISMDEIRKIIDSCKTGPFDLEYMTEPLILREDLLVRNCQKREEWLRYVSPILEQNCTTNSEPVLTPLEDFVETPNSVLIRLKDYLSNAHAPEALFSTPEILTIAVPRLMVSTWYMQPQRKSYPVMVSPVLEYSSVDGLAVDPRLEKWQAVSYGHVIGRISMPLKLNSKWFNKNLDNENYVLIGYVKDGFEQACPGHLGHMIVCRDPCEHQKNIEQWHGRPHSISLKEGIEDEYAGNFYFYMRKDVADILYSESSPDMNRKRMTYCNI